jgi:hypothetical protein
VIGHGHRNPIIDTSLYEVEFDDGRTGVYSTIIIAQHIYEQVDDDGQQHILFDDVIDHRKGTDAVSPDDGFVLHNGRRTPKRTTKGWNMLVQWKDATTTWLLLKDLKESNPVQLAEYAVAHKLVHEPAFSWWVPYTLRKHDCIIKAARTRFMSTDQKFGIELPKTVKRALEIDKETGTTFWRDALAKEMFVMDPVVKILPPGSRPPVGHTRVPCHIIFDIQMDFTRKVRFVAGGHVTEPPSTVTYASVVSRESVRIGFLVAALNDLDIMSADIQGAYLNATCAEKVCTICVLSLARMKEELV